MASLVVGIAGGSGSGKSWLSDYLAQHLPGRAVHLREDWYFRDRSGLSPREILRVNFDHPSAIDAARLLRDLDALRAGRPIDAPRYDYAAHARLPVTQRVEPAPVILLEGLFVLHRPTLRRRIAIRVFIDVPSDIRLTRRIRRDIEARGIPVEETLRLWERFVHPMHDRFIAPSARHARHLWRPARDRAFPRRLVAEIRRRLTDSKIPVAERAKRLARATRAIGQSPGAIGYIFCPGGAPPRGGSGFPRQTGMSAPRQNRFACLRSRKTLSNCIPVRIGSRPR